MSLLNNMKNQINKAGGSKKKIFYVKEGGKGRVRFLLDFEEGLELTFHDSFNDGINAICLEELGKDCPLCEEEGLRTRKLYCWPVWDYDAKEVKLFIFAVNNCTPVPALIGLYEAYGTILDRDYVIGKQGKQQNTSYTVIAMDKAKFRNKDAKIPTKKAILKLLEKAFPLEEDVDFDEEDDDEPKKKKGKKADKSSKKAGNKKGKKKDEDEDDEDEIDEDDIDDEDEDEEEYEEMSAKELYKLCQKRKIKCKSGKKANYYIDLLEEADLEDEIDEDEEDEDNEW
jgi:hypothetical protein